MPQSFYTVCYPNTGLEIKRIRLSNPVRIKLEGLFDDQKTELLADVQNEVDFDGDWHPESDEILTIDPTPEIQSCINVINNPAVNITDLDIAAQGTHPVKAIFTGSANNGQTELLMQKFSPSQILGRNKLALLLNNNTFGELTGDAFTLDGKLVCIIEGGKVKFKSFHNLRTIFELSTFFTVATDDDINSFAGHASLNIADLNDFKNISDVGMRKQIHAIIKNDTLSNYTAVQIRTAAQRAGINCNVNNGQIQMPDDKADIKNLLYFLNDGLYEAPLSSIQYIANSKKAM